MIRIFQYITNAKWIFVAHCLVLRENKWLSRLTYYCSMQPLHYSHTIVYRLQFTIISLLLRIVWCLLITQISYSLVCYCNTWNNWFLGFVNPIPNKALNFYLLLPKILMVDCWELTHSIVLLLVNGYEWRKIILILHVEKVILDSCKIRQILLKSRPQ